MNVSESKRPCIVTLGFGKKKTKEEATFHGIYQRAHTTVGVLAGSVSGQYAEPIAVVEVWGRLMWVEVGRVLFTDCPNKEDQQ